MSNVWLCFASRLNYSALVISAVVVPIPKKAPADDDIRAVLALFHQLSGDFAMESRVTRDAILEVPDPPCAHPRLCVRDQDTAAGAEWWDGAPRIWWHSVHMHFWRVWRGGSCTCCSRFFATFLTAFLCRCFWFSSANAPPFACRQNRNCCCAT